jgi:hypothetical protein
MPTRSIALAVLAAALALGGCASPQKIQQAGYAHLQRANELEAAGDYYGASTERAAADKQFRKASERSYAWGGYPGQFYRY